MVALLYSFPVIVLAACHYDRRSFRATRCVRVLHLLAAMLGPAVLYEFSSSDLCSATQTQSSVTLLLLGIYSAVLLTSIYPLEFPNNLHFI